MSFIGEAMKVDQGIDHLRVDGHAIINGSNYAYEPRVCKRPELEADKVFALDRLAWAGKCSTRKLHTTPGIDGLTATEMRERFNDDRYLTWLNGLLVNPTEKLRFIPGAIKVHEIPKSNGGKRKLQIANILDRAVQRCIALPLGDLADETFHPGSHGFRKGKGPLTALADFTNAVSVYPWAIKIDFETFFDLINRERLMSLLRDYGLPHDQLDLIKRFISAKVIDNGENRNTKFGIAQGGPLSPVLANIYLNPLDHWISGKGFRHVRYADDLIIFVESENQGKDFFHMMGWCCQRQFKAPINSVKSKVVTTKDLQFLGFNLDENGSLKAPMFSAEDLRTAMKNWQAQHRSYPSEALARLRIHILSKAAYWMIAPNFPILIESIAAELMVAGINNAFIRDLQLELFERHLKCQKLPILSACRWNKQASTHSELEAIMHLT